MKQDKEKIRKGEISKKKPVLTPPREVGVSKCVCKSTGSTCWGVCVCVGVGV